MYAFDWPCASAFGLGESAYEMGDQEGGGGGAGTSAAPNASIAFIIRE